MRKMGGDRLRLYTFLICYRGRPSWLKDYAAKHSRLVASNNNIVLYTLIYIE